MTINDKKYLEGQDIEYIDCPKNQQKFAQGYPDSIVIHYTAGKDGKSSAQYLAKDHVKASAHLVIDKTGKIYQLVPFDTIAWHAGVSEYNGRKGFNNFSIGIEIDNAGVLEKTGNEYISWFGKKYPEEKVIQAVHRNEKSPRYWHVYEEQQIELCFSVCEMLLDAFPQINMILGHEEISPGRKTDPGPAFPLDKLRERLIHNDRMTDDMNQGQWWGTTIPEKLNIRTGPGTDYDTAAEPLQKDTKVTVINRLGGWYQVKTEVKGWVSSEYVQLTQS